MSVIVLMMVAVIVGWRVTADREASTTTVGSDRDKVFAGLPAQLSPGQVPDLPADRGVGRAALLYHRDVDVESFDFNTKTFKQNDVYLVTRSGEQFRVGRTSADTSPLNMSLSPDGRWLGFKRDGEWRVRDVSGTAEYETPKGSGDTRDLLVVAPDQLGPGEITGPIIALLHGGGNPPSLWVEVGRPDLWPTDNPEGMLVAPTVALVGVDAATGAASGRIDLDFANGFPAEICRGVVAEGVVLQRWTKTTTELVVVAPHSNTRQVATAFPGRVTVIVPGARV